MNKKLLTVLIHISGWMAFFLFPFLLLNVSHSNDVEHLKNFHHPGNPRPEPSFLFFFLRNSLLIVFFYLNLFLLLPKLYYRQKKMPYFLIVFIFMLIAIYLPSYVRAEFMPPKMPLPDAGLGVPRRGPDTIGSVFGFLHFLIIWFLSSIIHLAGRYRQMEQKNKEMRVQKLDAELSYLKAQINPHFLFNTLNNIYALAITQHDQTPEAILKLSDIMRYVTEDANTATVPLQKELDYLENYITLQQLRSNDKLTVDFTITGEAGTNSIAPLLLINFIENAFKYGVSNHEPCFINIHILINERQLTLTVKNKVMVVTAEQSTFTGTNNTLRRLHLQYAKKHNLTIDENDNLYGVFLQLDLA
ncbi:histidine kinase [Ferruginibacter paludis]|uniref:sensor histidine kinase n=1 Tax=Ferruginibacter paludis TaxID=1310417 RepID=UPI0025B46718|nr:sensor histidine kinase [Ferruginibacter paludis]MDN3657993.1 histidine kinase [Ferruginibacter paludis]